MRVSWYSDLRTGGISKINWWTTTYIPNYRWYSPLNVFQRLSAVSCLLTHIVHTKVLSYCQIESTTFDFFLLYFWWSIRVFQNSCCLVIHQVGASVLSTGGLVINLIDDQRSAAFGVTNMFYLFLSKLKKRKENNTLKYLSVKKSHLSNDSTLLIAMQDGCVQIKVFKQNVFDNVFPP